MHPLESLYTRYPCRERQIKALALVLTQAHVPSPPALVLYGTEATGKSTIAKAVLDEFDVPHAYIRCKECITSRHLFEKALAGCGALAGSQTESPTQTASGLDNAMKQSRPDSVNSLAGQLQKLLTHSGKVVLVLDGIDKQKDITPATLSGLCEMGRMISNLTILMIVNVHGARLMSTAEPPSIHFPAYNKDECVKVLSLNPMSIFDMEEEDDYSAEMQEEDNWLWGQSCSAVWEIMGKHAARNVTSLGDLMRQLWPLLIQPILDKEYGIRDFPKLLNRLKNDKLRNNEESYVYSRIGGSQSLEPEGNPNDQHDLPFFSKYLLCAAFLASYNSAKYDARYFSKLSEDMRKRKRTSRKKQAGYQLNRKHLGPRPFPLERMLAIFQAILPAPLLPSVDLGSQIATLSSLRLIRKVSNVSSATDASSKWRVNIGYEYAKFIGRSVKLDIDNHIEQ